MTRGSYSRFNTCTVRIVYKCWSHFPPFNLWGSNTKRWNLPLNSELGYAFLGLADPFSLSRDVSMRKRSTSSVMNSKVLLHSVSKEKNSLYKYNETLNTQCNNPYICKDVLSPRPLFVRYNFQVPVSTLGMTNHKCHNRTPIHANLHLSATALHNR